MDSPYEVHDYVKAYLGDTPQAKDFAKQFLERRAKQNANHQKPQQDQQQKQQVHLCACTLGCLWIVLISLTKNMPKNIPMTKIRLWRDDSKVNKR